MDIGEPFLTQYRGKRASFMVKEFVPGALVPPELSIWPNKTQAFFREARKKRGAYGHR
jgi:hypothetical protein